MSPKDSYVLPGTLNDLKTTPRDPSGSMEILGTPEIITNKTCKDSKELPGTPRDSQRLLVALKESYVLLVALKES